MPRYYIDGIRGNDGNSGASLWLPWKSLRRVNATVFAPGDRVLFRAGTRYRGQLKVRGSGRKGAPIRMGVYGRGPRPRIDGEGAHDYTLHLYNVEYWEVSGLEVTNIGREPRPRSAGVAVQISDFGTAHGIVLRDLYVHDVDASMVKTDGGGCGILWLNGGKRKRSRFDGLLIEGCLVKNCIRDGIKGAGYSERDNWWPSLNVVIRNNHLDGVPGDGILPIGCDGALVEYNVMRRCPPMARRKGGAAAGIWPWSCDNTIIQYNEVDGHQNWVDGMGYDQDENCLNTIFQYNVSRNNKGGFMLVCAYDSDPKKNVRVDGSIIRYNISINDGEHIYLRRNPGYAPVFYIAGPVKNIHIYNNLIFLNRRKNLKRSSGIVTLRDVGGWPKNVFFSNNIFHVESPNYFDLRKAVNVKFNNNIYSGPYTNLPYDAQAIRAKPKFVGPLDPREGFEKMAAFMLKNGSAGIRKGKIILRNGGNDFFGNALKYDRRPCVGPHEVS